MSAEIIDSIYSQLNSLEVLNDDVVREIIYKRVSDIKASEDLSLKSAQDLIEQIFNKIRRLGLLTPLLEDDSITEIMVNGYDQIFVERMGKLEFTDYKFNSSDELVNIIHKIVSTVNRSVNTANPIVDARLLDGSRVNAVLPPISLNGPTLTIRKFSKKKFSLDDYVSMGSLSAEARDDLRSFVRHKFNIFISGGTGSGKTTFLNALSKEIGIAERVITIEDSAELQLDNIKNWVRLETRNTNSENVGEISIRDLIKTALRMRPDRIVVGEVRGGEALDMLQAMNTGHDGSLSTAHANSAYDMLTRLETMVYCAAQIPLDAIKKQICAAIDIMVHLGKLGDGSRKVLEISALSHVDNGEIVIIPIYEYREVISEDGKKRGELIRTANEIPRVYKLKAV